MRARRTYNSNAVFRLVGGTEDNDLWVERAVTTEGDAILQSVWEPTDDERREIAEGANVRLTTWGTGTPPLMVDVTDEPLGKAPGADDEPS